MNEIVCEMRKIIDGLHAALLTASNPAVLLEYQIQCGFYMHMYSGLNVLLYAKIPESDAVYVEFARECSQLEGNLVELAELAGFDPETLLAVAGAVPDYEYLVNRGFAHAIEDRVTARRVAHIKPAGCYE